MDTLGMLLACSVTAGSVQDRDGAPGVISMLKGRFSRLRVIWADGGYAGALERAMKRLLPRRPVRLEIVRRPPGVRGFTLIPKRWMVERTFAWLFGHRRLCCHYETTTSSAEAHVKIAMIRLMLRRVAAAV